MNGATAPTGGILPAPAARVNQNEMPHSPQGASWGSYTWVRPLFRAGSDCRFARFGHTLGKPREGWPPGNAEPQLGSWVAGAESYLGMDRECRAPARLLGRWRRILSWHGPGMPSPSSAPGSLAPNSILAWTRNAEPQLGSWVAGAEFHLGMDRECRAPARLLGRWRRILSWHGPGMPSWGSAFPGA